MKKLTALLLVFVMLFAFAACKEEEKLTFEQAMSREESIQQSKIEESKVEESKIQVEIDKYIEKVGYSKPLTCLVVMFENSNGREYLKFNFDENGEFKEHIKYYFFNLQSDYDFQLDKYKNHDAYTVVDKDYDMRMIAVRLDEYVPRSFYEHYQAYAVHSQGVIIGDVEVIEEVSEIVSEAMLTSTTLSYEEIIAAGEDQEPSKDTADYKWIIIAAVAGGVVIVAAAVVIIIKKKKSGEENPEPAKDKPKKKDE